MNDSILYPVQMIVPSHPWAKFQAKFLKKLNSKLVALHHFQIEYQVKLLIFDPFYSSTFSLATWNRLKNSAGWLYSIVCLLHKDEHLIPHSCLSIGGHKSLSNFSRISVVKALGALILEPFEDIKKQDAFSSKFRIDWIFLDNCHCKMANKTLIFYSVHNSAQAFLRFFVLFWTQSVEWFLLFEQWIVCSLRPKKLVKAKILNVKVQYKTIILFTKSFF